MSATASELLSFITSELEFDELATPILPDKEYSLPAPDWITNDLSAAVNKSISSAGLVYTRDANDCDDFSLFYHWVTLTAVLIAKQKHAKATGKTALAVGMLGYIQDNGQGHAIIMAIALDPITLKLQALYIEPQDGLEKKLSLNEKNHALYLLM